MNALQACYQILNEVFPNSKELVDSILSFLSKEEMCRYVHDTVLADMDDEEIHSTYRAAGYALIEYYKELC